MPKRNKIRLHKFLTLQIKARDDIEYTIPEIQRNIVEFGVDIDGVRVYNRLEWLYPNQSIAYAHWPKRPVQDFTRVSIFAETETFLLIYKPPGVVVHAGAGHTKQNLVSWLEQNIPGFIQEFPLEEYPQRGLVHRIDKQTQGLVLVAKTQNEYTHLKHVFALRNIQKVYLTTLHGILTKELDCTSWVTRDTHNPLRQKNFWDKDTAATYSEKIRQAHSVFTPLVISEESNQTLVEVMIHTGRMHQIRLHAESLGYPLWQEPVYSKKHTEPYPMSFVKPADPYSLSAEKFYTMQQSLFETTEYSLLANSLSFIDSLGIHRKYVYKNLNDIMAETHTKGDFLGQ